MSKIRVLRLLEYTYDSVERMETDMAAWSSGRPFQSGMGMKSVTLPLEVLSLYEDMMNEESKGK